MILTGPAIKTSVKYGRITLAPFNPNSLNPNSYNFHLGNTLLIHDPRGKRRKEVKIKPNGFVLMPGKIYFGATHEKIGSEYFATILLGRSSIGRLGIFLNVTADLGHIGSCSHWTLEITVIQPVRIYPMMAIGQVSFWVTDYSTPYHYKGRYHNDDRPVTNRDRKLKRNL